MNKQDLKSLLENIYTALTEEADNFVGPPAPEDLPPPDAEKPPIRYKPTSSTPMRTFPLFPGDDPAIIAEINRLLALIQQGGGLTQSISILQARMRLLIQQVLRARQERRLDPWRVAPDNRPFQVL